MPFNANVSSFVGHKPFNPCMHVGTLASARHFEGPERDMMTAKSILIVEDEIFVAMDIERILVDAGFQVIAIAADSDEAIAAAEAADIAFVDLNLRDGPIGPALARALGERYGVRVVYVTANPAQIDVPAENAIACIRKPFDDAAILAAATLASGQDVDVTPYREMMLPMNRWNGASHFSAD